MHANVCVNDKSVLIRNMYPIICVYPGKLSDDKEVQTSVYFFHYVRKPIEIVDIDSGEADAAGAPFRRGTHALNRLTINDLDDLLLPFVRTGPSHQIRSLLSIMRIGPQTSSRN